MKNEIIKILNSQLSMYKRVIKVAEEQLKNAPEGSLSISFKHGRPQYYQYIPDKITKKTLKRFLKKNESELVRSLAQKSYDKAALKIAIEQANIIENFIKKYDVPGLKKTYSSLSAIRRPLVKVYELDDAEYARRWQAVPYTPKGFAEGDPEYCAKVLKKLSVYIRNDIIPGDKLIMSFESSSVPLNVRDLEKQIMHFMDCK